MQVDAQDKPAPRKKNTRRSGSTSAFCTPRCPPASKARRPSLIKKLRKLRRLSRRLSREQKGRRNRKKAKIRVARLHRRMANIRLDGAHRLTTNLTQRSGLIVLEV